MIHTQSMFDKLKTIVTDIKHIQKKVTDKNGLQAIANEMISDKKEAVLSAIEESFAVT